jgi:hypothetical protein
MSKSKKQVSFPVDLVYTWVDGNDPVWREKRNKYMPERPTTGHVPNHINDARWRENNELMYSLRSVEKYAPWVNRIYIVTDGQTPKWLNTNHPKIKIVDHSEILPADALPVFSSHAIESCIHKIPGLSEHFVYGNDDTFFGSPTTADDFFHADGRAIVRVKGTRFKRKRARTAGNYYRVLYRMQSLVQERWGRLVCHEPHHNFDAYRKSDFETCVATLAEEWNRTAHSRFRTNDDMQRCYVSYYAVATGNATLRKVNRYNRITNPISLVKALVTGRYAADSRWIKLHIASYDKDFDKYNPLMFCMNDNANTSDEDCKRMLEFLKSKFPTKSSFEL